MSNYPELGESQFTLFVYGTLASVEEDIIPETYALSQAYPNPLIQARSSDMTCR